MSTDSIEELIRSGDYEAALRRLVEADPDLAGPMEGIRLCIDAARICEARLTDYVIAGKRTAVRPPPPFCLPYVKAAVMRAQESHAEAKEALEEGRAEVPAVSGVLTLTSGETARFADLVDADDLTGPLLPCFEGGSVLDVPYCDLLSLELLPRGEPFDRVWAPARLVMRDGGDLLARVPALYTGSRLRAEPRVRLGQITMWDRSRGYAEGAGQRELRLSLEGGEMAAAGISVGINQVKRIDFDAPEGPEEARRAFLSRMSP